MAIAGHGGYDQSVSVLFGIFLCVKVDGLITVVDAVHIATQLNSSDGAEAAQVRHSKQSYCFYLLQSLSLSIGLALLLYINNRIYRTLFSGYVVPVCLTYEVT